MKHSHNIKNTTIQPVKSRDAHCRVSAPSSATEYQEITREEAERIVRSCENLPQSEIKRLQTQFFNEQLWLWSFTLVAHKPPRQWDLLLWRAVLGLRNALRTKYGIMPDFGKAIYDMSEEPAIDDCHWSEMREAECGTNAFIGAWIRLVEDNAAKADACSQSATLSEEVSFRRERLEAIKTVSDAMDLILRSEFAHADYRQAVQAESDSSKQCVESESAHMS